jgi:acyl-lipid omega-6 desaturase (Delta-12 desaturase)
MKFDKSPRRLVSHFAKDITFLAMMLTVWHFVGGWAAALVSAPIVAVLMFRNFSLMHDAVHAAVIVPRRLNDLVGLWSGTIALLPFEAWKKVHLQHHTWAGNIDQDPVMLIVNAYPTWPAWLRSTLDVFWKSWLPLVALLQYGVFWLSSLRVALRETPSIATVLSLVVPPLVWCGMLFWLPTTFVLAGLVPGLGLYLLMAEVVNLPHHLELPQYRGETKLPLWEQHRIARTCLYPKWFAENVVLNFNYHLEHHLYPSLSWYHLAEIHELLRSELGTAYNTDPKFSWILKNRPRSLAVVMRAMQDESHSDQRDRAA